MSTALVGQSTRALRSEMEVAIDSEIIENFLLAIKDGVPKAIRDMAEDRDDFDDTKTPEAKSLSRDKMWKTLNDIRQPMAFLSDRTERDGWEEDFLGCLCDLAEGDMWPSNFLAVWRLANNMTINQWRKCWPQNVDLLEGV